MFRNKWVAFLHYRTDYPSSPLRTALIYLLLSVRESKLESELTVLGGGEWIVHSISERSHPLLPFIVVPLVLNVTVRCVQLDVCVSFSHSNVVKYLLTLSFHHHHK